MLGMTIADEGFESTQHRNNAISGLQLLPVHTVFHSYEKETKQVQKYVTGSGPILDKIRSQKIRGYEIHMGSTTTSFPIFGDDGAQDETGLVLGTYLHGLFHNDNLLCAFVNCLTARQHRKKPMESQEWNKISDSNNNKQSLFETQGDPFDDIATVLKQNLDMAALYKIIGF